MRIEEATALVTGAASGMGARFATALASAGARVIAIDHDIEGLERLASGAATPNLSTEAFDITQERAVTALLRDLAARDSLPDILVNNAAILRDGYLATLESSGYARKMPTAQWSAVIATNLTAPFLLAREFVAHRLEAGREGGLIVNISSISSAGNAGQSNYAAAKAGLDALTRTWSLELAPHGVRVAGLAPGVTDTPMSARLAVEVRERLIADMPLGRMIRTEEIWLGLRFIIECDAFVGRVLSIDGGAAF
jgi:3-oxoacyl-[acyl-carrier protein] reductase